MGGMLLSNPDELLHSGEIPELVHRPDERSLGSNDNYFESLLVDKNGNEYDPYSLAWRYLGLYIDCEYEDSDENGYSQRGRRLKDDDDENDCERKLLWAAYHDKRYRGNTIEEYQFFDLASGEWDDSACKASGERHRCVRMDCHESGSHFKLVGVFKETEGMYDFTEQLFKHEGICIWNDDDVYETMETWMENWPTQCTSLSMPDYDGNTLYIAVQPLAEGNMTLGIYRDESCTYISQEMTLTSYIVRLYQNSYSYYYSSDMGYEVAAQYEQAIQDWNDNMQQFKICQPCKAYNLLWDKSDDDRSSNDHRARLLGGEDNDGDGEEQERYNCYDDAGYTNVNQCYKFESKTSLEAAEMEDLVLASSQGTILRIKVNGKTFGEGGFTSPASNSMKALYISLGIMAAVMLTIAVRLIQRGVFKEWKRRKRRRVTSKILRESLYGTDPMKNDKSKHYEGKGSYRAPSEAGTTEESVEIGIQMTTGASISESGPPEISEPMSRIINRHFKTAEDQEYIEIVRAELKRMKREHNDLVQAKLQHEKINEFEGKEVKGCAALESSNTRLDSSSENPKGANIKEESGLHSVDQDSEGESPSGINLDDAPIVCHDDGAKTRTAQKFVEQSDSFEIPSAEPVFAFVGDVVVDASRSNEEQDAYTSRPANTVSGVKEAVR